MHCVQDITPTISEMASTVSESSQRLHWWSQTNCMYDITPTIRMPSYALYKTSYPLFMFSHHCIYHITSTAFMITPTVYEITYTLLWHHSHSIYDKTPTIFVTSNSVYKTSHIMNEWQKKRMYLTWYPMYLCNQTHMIDDITTYVRMESHPLHVLQHRHFIWHHIDSFFFFFFYLWWILSYIEMKQPWVYMCSPFQSPLPPPTSPVPSMFSQCTRSEHLSHASKLGWWSVSP